MFPLATAGSGESDFRTSRLAPELTVVEAVAELFPAAGSSGDGMVAVLVAGGAVDALRCADDRAVRRRRVHVHDEREGPGAIRRERRDRAADRSGPTNRR